MNLRDLHYLVTVAQTLHFGKAAQLCHTSQPTLSMQLKKLEDTLGVQLFERSNKHVMITPVGAQIVEMAKKILVQEGEIRALARSARDPLAGEITLGAFPTLAPYLFPHIIAPLHAALPALKFWLVEEKTPILREKLLAGELDAALLALPLEDERLEFAELFDDPFLLAVAPQHPLTKHKKVTLEALQDEPLLLLEDGHCLRTQALEVCQLHSAKEHQEFRATSLETLRHMVAMGMGVTLIPQLAMRPDDGVRYLPFKEPAPARRIALCWRKHSARTVCIARIVEVLRALKLS